MLVLSRKVGQTILVGKDLVLQIVKVQGGRVKISISAPESVRIRRGELNSREFDFGVEHFPVDEVESGVPLEAGSDWSTVASL